MEQHNYVQAVLDYVAKYNVPLGKINELGIFHDDWCGIYESNRCDCNPVVKWIAEEDRPKLRPYAIKDNPQ